jgi:hypothetical protein
MCSLECRPVGRHAAAQFKDLVDTGENAPLVSTSSESL